MEDILAIVAVLALVGVFWYTLHKLLAWRKEKVEAEELRREEISKRLREIEREQAAKHAARRLANTSSVPKETKKVTAEPAKPTYAPSPTQSMDAYQSSRSGLDDLADIAIIANTMRHWNDNSRSEPVREERSVGVTKTESSWGFDDSDSRKSISSSMDTDTSSSWFSSSSSSDSSWSSSDSGPSSDW